MKSLSFSAAWVRSSGILPVSIPIFVITPTVGSITFRAFPSHPFWRYLLQIFQACTYYRVSILTEELLSGNYSCGTPDYRNAQAEDIGKPLLTIVFPALPVTAITGELNDFLLYDARSWSACIVLSVMTKPASGKPGKFSGLFQRWRAWCLSGKDFL